MLRTVFLAFFLATFSPIVLAELCWMVGCQDQVGYIRIKPSPSGAPLPFVGKTRPAVGNTALLCEPAFLRVYAIAGALGKEPDREVAGNLLGPNTTVKVLEYISRTSDPLYAGDFAIVRVLKDDNTCPKGCSKCGDFNY